MDDEVTFNLPESTRAEVLYKIEALAGIVIEDWDDPRGECRLLVDLCKKLTTMKG